MQTCSLNVLKLYVLWPDATVGGPELFSVLPATFVWHLPEVGYSLDEGSPRCRLLT